MGTALDEPTTHETKTPTTIPAPPCTEVYGVEFSNATSAVLRMIETAAEKVTAEIQSSSAAHAVDIDNITKIASAYEAVTRGIVAAHVPLFNCNILSDEDQKGETQ